MADNPFLQPSALPYELPAFDRIRDGHYRPAFEAGMREQRREVDAIAHNPRPPDFENTIVALERSGQVLDRVSTVVLGLDGQSGAESFANYAQWEFWQAERTQTVNETGRSPRLVPGFAEPPVQAQKKLSYLEAREYAGIERRITEAEQVLQTKRAELQDPAIASDGPMLVRAQAGLEAAQKDLDALYARWAELEQKAGSLPPR